jgi:hypothetical protein
MGLPLPKDAHAPIDVAETPAASRRPSTAGGSRYSAKVFIATVDLGRLGKWVKGQRKKKNMQYLYVLGQNPVGFGPVVEEDSDRE